MRLFGPLYLAILSAIGILAVGFSLLVRRGGLVRGRPVFHRSPRGHPVRILRRTCRRRHGAPHAKPDRTVARISAVCFFAAHGGIVVCAAAVVFVAGKPLPLRAVWRSFGFLLIYRALVGAVDAIPGADYMFLLRKPDAASPLDFFGPWPWYLAAGAALALVLFWALWWLASLMPASRRNEKTLHLRP
jgi:hypothetical protein